jgi:hypothetical protein
MRMAVLPISGNVYKQQEMEIDTALSEFQNGRRCHGNYF